MFRQCGIICFSIELCNCFDSVALFVFLLDFDIVPTVWHYFFLLDFGTVSDSVNIICFLWGFGTIPTVWHYRFIYCTLELIRQSGMIVFSMGLWNSTDSGSLFVVLLYFGTVLTV